MNRQSENLSDLLNRLIELNKFLVSQIEMAHKELQMRRSELNQHQHGTPAAPLKSKADFYKVALLWQEHLN
jgi:hypothetical protein